jgi:hypothetical protein
MGTDPASLLKDGAVIAVALWFTGFCALVVGVRKARSAFREKGFLRVPQGTAWLRFLFLKQYEWFEAPSIRFFFGASHLCLLALIVVVGAMIVLVGSEFLLNGMDAFSLTGPGAPTLPLP